MISSVWVYYYLQRFFIGMQRTLDSLITVFHQGAILVEGRADKVLADPSVREVYLGNRA